MMIRLLFLLLLGFVVYAVFVMLLRQLTGRRPPQVPREKTSHGEEMVKDPQCGTYLPRGDAVTGQVNGEVRYFCSDKCRDKFSR